MELNLSELNTMNPYDTFDYNSYEEQNGINYWEKPKVEEKTRKKKVSFNDILSNMNLVVNKQGVLQFMSPNQEVGYNPNDFNQEQQYSQQQYKKPQYKQPQYQQPQYKQPQSQVEKLNAIIEGK